MSRLEHRPIRRLDHDATHRSEEPGRDRPRASSSDIGRPVSRVHLQSPLDTLRIVGVDASCRDRIDPGQLRMHRRPSGTIRLAFDVGPDRGVRRRQHREPSLQSPEVQPSTAGEQGDSSRGSNVRDRVQGIVTKLAGRVPLVRIANVDETMRRPAQHLATGLARTDIEVPEHQRRVHS